VKTAGKAKEVNGTGTIHVGRHDSGEENGPESGQPDPDDPSKDAVAGEEEQIETTLVPE
jgi:hypothetical protein